MDSPGHFAPPAACLHGGASRASVSSNCGSAEFGLDNADNAEYAQQLSAAIFPNAALSDATTIFDDSTSHWRVDAHDVPPFGRTISAIHSLGGFAVAPCIHNTRHVADTCLDAASAPVRVQQDGNRSFDQFVSAPNLPWSQDVSCESNVDHGTDQYDYVALSDLELCNSTPEQYNANMPLSDYAHDASFRYGAMETATQDSAMNSMIVPKPLQLPSKSHRGPNRCRSSHDRRTRDRPCSQPNAVIKDWYFQHSASPYPPSEYIAALATLSGQSERQVKTCLSNLRARAKAKDCTVRSSPQPATHDATSHYMQVNPHPFSEDLTIVGADVDTEMLTETGADLIESEKNHSSYSEPSLSPYSGKQPHTLVCTELDQSSHPGSRRKGRRQHPSRFDPTFCEPTSLSPHTFADNGSDAKTLYHCTVCRKSFKDVYGWKRHESSVHGYSDIEWVCMLSHNDLGAPGQMCIFCHDIFDSFNHFEEHDVQCCLNKSICDRTFARKDLLKQHVQQKHLATVDESISRTFKIPDAWSQEVHAVRIKEGALWCGFCLSTCDTIAERMDHVAEHFRNGDDMKTWIPHAIM